MKQQLLLFGASVPLGEVAADLRPTVVDRLVLLFEEMRDAHIPVEWPVDVDHLLPVAGQDERPDDILGIVIAARNLERLNYPEPDDIREAVRNPRVVDLDPVPTPVTADYLIQFRFLAGTSQAIIDWEVVRLAVRSLGVDLGPGRLWLVEHDDEG